MKGAEYSNLMSLLRDIRLQLKKIKEKLNEQNRGDQREAGR